MAYIQGEGRSQGTLFTVVLDDVVPSDHMCRVIDAFVGRLDMDRLSFERAEPADRLPIRAYNVLSPACNPF